MYYYFLYVVNTLLFITILFILYNKEMKKALLLHQEYYSNADRDQNRAGAISIPLTAMAVLAKDAKGYDLTVENGYIPQWIINGKPAEYK